MRPHFSPSFTGFSEELKDSIKPADLSSEDHFLYTLLKDDLDVFTNGYKWRFHGTYNAVNFLETIPIDFMSFLIDTTRFDDVKDFQKYVKRLDQIPRQISQQISMMEVAVKEKTTYHR